MKRPSIRLDNLEIDPHKDINNNLTIRFTYMGVQVKVKLNFKTHQCLNAYIKESILSKITHKIEVIVLNVENNYIGFFVRINLSENSNYESKVFILPYRI